MIGTWKKWMMSGSVLLVVAALACGPVVPAFAAGESPSQQATVSAAGEQMCGTATMGDDEKCPGGSCEIGGDHPCKACCDRFNTPSCGKDGCKCEPDNLGRLITVGGAIIILLILAA